MKTLTALLLTLLFSLFAAPFSFAASPIHQDGYFKNIRMAGRVKVVEHFGDVKVKVVSSFPDLRVKVVSSFPDDIGEWQFVDYGEDFTIEYVDSFPDICIKFVDSFPGIN